VEFILINELLYSFCNGTSGRLRLILDIIKTLRLIRVPLWQRYNPGMNACIYSAQADLTTMHQISTLNNEPLDTLAPCS
jgi:hypothetical protein